MTTLSEMKAMFEGTPYSVRSGLAYGGMAIVLAAQHRTLGKDVVIKVLRGGLAERADLTDRLRLEAQTLARVRHPNLIEVTDLGRTIDGKLYLVMERLYGRTLGKELEARGPLPVAETLEIGRQIAAGLVAAHEVGVIHRDVKLDNVFYCDPPRGGGPRAVKILDFGIAKITAAIEGDFPKLAIPTATGVMVGTPRYLAPEQARGEVIDHRVDIYSTGVVLYALLTGKGPFHHLTDPLEILKAQLDGKKLTPPSARALVTHAVPAWLDSVVLKALARDREDRYRTAADLRDALAGDAGPKWDVTELMPAVVAGAPADDTSAEEPTRFVDRAGADPATLRDSEINRRTAVVRRGRSRALVFVVLVLLSAVVFTAVVEGVKRIGGGG